MRILCILMLITLEINALSITSLNIQWYGRGGMIEGNESDEYRGERLRDFLFNQLPKSDVYVFQEVTAPSLLTNTLPELNCDSYENSIARHQYVVTCYKKYIKGSSRANYKIQLGNPRMRAALVSELELNNYKKVKVIGVHLKAGPDYTQYRLKQIENLKTSINKDESVVIIGDFNTFPKERTKLEKDDQDFISDYFSSYDLTKTPMTLKTHLWRDKRIFDLAWYKNLNLISSEVYGPCRKTSVNSPYNKENFYRRFISDHCAIQVVFE